MLAMFQAHGSIQARDTFRGIGDQYEGEQLLKPIDTSYGGLLRFGALTAVSRFGILGDYLDE
jgi:hypothetical protein